VLAARFATEPMAAWLVDVTGGELGPSLAPWFSGALIAMATVVAVGLLGRMIRRGARFAGLGWADRLGGAALGAAEGTLVAILIVLGTTFVIGRQHPSVEPSKSLRAYDEVRSFVVRNRDQLPGSLPSVAAPPGR
jgi:uncharacterized membrane protein required for colicin V production